jgi:hypothetical protein
MKWIGVFVLITLVLISAPVSALTYDQMARNPDQYIGESVTITGQVSQVMYETDTLGLRIYTGKSSYGSYVEDDIMVVFSPIPKGSRVLEDDMVRITGRFGGEYRYETLLGAVRTVPGILGETVEILWIMDDSINAFGEEIGRNAARATYDLLTLHITPGSLILAGVILGVVAIVTYPRWIEKIDGNGTIRKNFSIRLCDDPVDD